MPRNRRAGRRRSARPLRARASRRAGRARRRCRHSRIGRQLAQQRPVELFRVHIGEARGAAPLPMLDQVAEQLAAPAGPALEKGETQIGEAPGHAAEEQRLGDGVPGRGEMADMVEGEVRRRVALAVAAAAGVEGGRDLQLAAFLPERVVIVVAVDAELVEARAKRATSGSRPWQPLATAGARRCRTCRPWRPIAW